MHAKPPPIPEIVYHRVITAGKVDGWLILLSAGIPALSMAQYGLGLLTVAMCLAAGFGAMEVHGARLLERGSVQGMNWLVGAQLLMLVLIMSVVIYFLGHFDEAFFRRVVIPFSRGLTAEVYPALGFPDFGARLSNTDWLLVWRWTMTIMLVFMAMVSCVYQGLMARYYFRRRDAVRQAIEGLFEADDDL